jgi:hypothetical protein
MSLGVLDATSQCNFRILECGSFFGLLDTHLFNSPETKNEDARYQTREGARMHKRIFERHNFISPLYR